MGNQLREKTRILSDFAGYTSLIKSFKFPHVFFFMFVCLFVCVYLCCPDRVFPPLTSFRRLGLFVNGK